MIYFVGSVNPSWNALVAPLTTLEFIICFLFYPHRWSQSVSDTSIDTVNCDFESEEREMRQSPAGE